MKESTMTAQLDELIAWAKEAAARNREQAGTIHDGYVKGFHLGWSTAANEFIRNLEAMR